MPADNPKTIDYRSSLRRRLLAGLHTAHKAVAVTYGPEGKQVCVQNGVSVTGGGKGPFQFTRDGWSVCKAIELDDRVQNSAVSIARLAALETNNNVGDGTSSTFLATTKLSELMLQNVERGYNPVDLGRGLEKALTVALGLLPDITFEFEGLSEVEDLATAVAADDRVIGKAVAEAVWESGKDGICVVEESPAATPIELVFEEGCTLNHLLDEKWLSLDNPTLPMVNGNGNSLTLQKPLILLSSIPLAVPNEWLPCLEQAANLGQSVVIFAPRVEGTFYTLCWQTSTRSNIVLAPVRLKSSVKDRVNDSLDDLAALTGARVFRPDLGDDPEKWTLADLGYAEKITFTRKHTLVDPTDHQLDAITKRCEWLLSHADRQPSAYEREQLTERSARLSGAYLILKVGGQTDSERQHRKLRVEDTLLAVQSALKSGVVRGGCETWLYLANELADYPERPDKDMSAEYLSWVALEETLAYLGGLLSESTEPDYPLYDCAAMVRSVLRTSVSTAKELAMAEVGVFAVGTNSETLEAF